MNKYLIFLLVFIVFDLQAQVDSLTVKDELIYKRSNWQYFLNNTETYLGISAGSETLIGLPKFGLQTKLYSTDNFNHYVGIDAGFNLIFVLWYYSNVYYGVQYKSVLFELSTGVWQEPKADPASIGPAKTSTVFSLTPKFGFNINQFELKIGHSLILYDDNDERNVKLLDTGIINFNVDIGLTYPLRETF